MSIIFDVAIQQSIKKWEDALEKAGSTIPVRIQLSRTLRSTCGLCDYAVARRDHIVARCKVCPWTIILGSPCIRDAWYRRLDQKLTRGVPDIPTLRTIIQYVLWCLHEIKVCYPSLQKRRENFDIL